MLFSFLFFLFRCAFCSQYLEEGAFGTEPNKVQEKKDASSIIGKSADETGVSGINERTNERANIRTWRGGKDEQFPLLSRS